MITIKAKISWSTDIDTGELLTKSEALNLAIDGLEASMKDHVKYITLAQAETKIEAYSGIDYARNAKRVDNEYPGEIYWIDEVIR